MKTDSRPVHFACFVRSSIRAILPLDSTSFLLFLCLLLFQFISFDFFFLFLFLFLFFSPCMYLSFSSSFGSDPLVPLFIGSFQKREDKFLVKSSDTRTTIYGLLRKGFPWEVKPWYVKGEFRLVLERLDDYPESWFRLDHDGKNYRIYFEFLSRSSLISCRILNYLFRLLLNLKRF